MDKLKRLLKKTPPVPLGIAGALLFLLLFYTLAFRTPLWQVWMPPNIDNDEVIYNRQVVSVIAHGGPLGYFGYNEGTADMENGDPFRYQGIGTGKQNRKESRHGERRSV